MRASIAVSIFASQDFTDYFFLAVKPVPTTETELEAASAQLAGKGLGWVGVIGMVDDMPQVSLEHVPDDPGCLSALSAAFVRYCNSLTTGDEVEWLERLYALPDVRN